MDRRNSVRWVYVGSALLCPVLFWALGGSHTWFRGPILVFELMPLSLVGLLLGATRRSSPAGVELQLAACGFWSLTCLAAAIWYPMFNRIDFMGGAAVTTIAIVTAGAAVALGALTVRTLVPRSDEGLASRVERILQALATGLLCLYLARGTLLLFGSPPLTPSANAERWTREVTLRLLVCGLAATSLAASLVVAMLGRRPAGVRVPSHE